jgi:hypothetical protein
LAAFYQRQQPLVVGLVFRHQCLSSVASVASAASLLKSFGPGTGKSARGHRMQVQGCSWEAWKN